MNENINESNYSSEYDTEEEPKRFQIKRWMLIVGIIVLLAIIVLVIVLVSRSKNDEDYTTEDFNRLETRMEEETPIYLTQKGIELTSEELRIDLDELLVKNGGSIDPDQVKAAKVCEGYVIASKVDTESYDAYIKCGDMYTTSGYVSNDNESNDNNDDSEDEEDTEEPVITIIGDESVSINQGSAYNDEGATAMDNVDGDITSQIVTENNVNTSESGYYTVIYRVSDSSGNTAEATRVVNVVSTITTTKKNNSSSSSGKTTTKRRVTTTTSRITTPPTITLKGSSYITLNQGDRYSDPGYSATDARGKDLTGSVKISGSVNTSVAGTYTIRYTVTDSYGNTATKTRTIKVNSTYVALQGISLTPNTVTLSVGATKTISVMFNPTNATNKSVSWSSSNASVATVSNGVITAKKAGTATITASAADGRKAYVSLVVR